ncbi:MAG: hypothetical protein AB1760_19730, partial [Pseudomonadota bacterium]
MLTYLFFAAGAIPFSVIKPSPNQKTTPEPGHLSFSTAFSHLWKAAGTPVFAAPLESAGGSGRPPGP